MSVGRPLNRTPDGELACAFGTPWLDHFGAPIGNGRGCAACDEEYDDDTNGNVQAGSAKTRAVTGVQGHTALSRGVRGRGVRQAHTGDAPSGRIDLSRAG